MKTDLRVRLTGGSLDWAEHCQPMQGPMTLQQLTTELARQVNRAHERASEWGMKDTAAGPYEAWQWCMGQRATGKAGQPSWLARQSLDRVQQLVALER